MKKILFTIVLSAITSSAIAYDYCATRPKQFDRNTCYKAVIEQNNKILMSTYDKAMASPRLPKANKIDLEKRVIDFYNRMNAGCRDDGCVVNSLQDQTAWIHRYYNQYATKAKK